MTDGGFLLYRCRLCGGVERKYHVPDVTEAIVSVLVTKATPREWGVQARLTCLHTCGPGKAGIADLIGGESDGGII